MSASECHFSSPKYQHVTFSARTMSHLCPKQPTPVCYIIPPGTRRFVPPPEAAPWWRLAWTVTLRVGSENTQWPWYDTLHLSTRPHCLEFKDSPLPITWIRIVMLIRFGVAQSVKKMNGIDSWLEHRILRSFQTGCIYTSSYKTGDFSHRCKGVRSVKLTNITILHT